MKHPAASPVRLAPVLRAIPFVGAQAGTTAPMPTPSQREQLARIGVRLRLPPRMMIYREQSPARWVFVVIEGVVKTFRDLPSGKRPVTAFLAPGDLFGLAGYARVDFRVDGEGRPTILEVNVNPCLNPDAGFAAAAAQGGLSYRDLIGSIIDAAPRALPALP